MTDVQFYAYTPPTLPAPETTPFLQAFKQPDNDVRISVRGRNGAHAEIVLSVEEALRFSMHLGAAKFAHEVVAARAERKNGERE